MRQYFNRFQKLPFSAYLSLVFTVVLLFTIGVTITNSLNRQVKEVKTSSKNISKNNSSDVKSSNIALVYISPTIYCLGGSPCTTPDPTQKPILATSTPFPTNIPTVTPTPVCKAEQSYKFKVTNERGEAKVSDKTGKSVYSSSDHSSAIQWALDNLTSGRAAKEKVWIVGDFIINNTIYIPSHVSWLLEGKLTLGNHVDKIMIADSPNGATDIEMSGGVYDGNKANQLVSAATDHVIKFSKVTKSHFRDMIMQNAVNDDFILDTLSNNNVSERLVGRWAGTGYIGPGATNDGNGLDDKGDHNIWIDCIAEDNYSDNWVIKSRDSTFIRTIGRGSKNAVGFGLFADRNISGNKFFDIKAYNNIHAGFTIIIPPKSDGKSYIIQNNYVEGEFYNNGTNGIRFSDSTKDGSVKNNTIDVWIYNNGAAGLWIQQNRINNNSGSIIAYDNKTSDIILLGTNTFNVYHSTNKAASKISKGSSKVNVIDFTCSGSNFGVWAVNKYCGNLYSPTPAPTFNPCVSPTPTIAISPTLTSSSTPLPSPTTTPDAKLLAYWDLDENKGKIVDDSSGNKHKGKLRNDPDWVKGKINSALEFDGRDDYVEVPDSKSLEGMDKITISAWIKSDLKEQKDRTTIFSKWENGAGGVYALRKWGSGISASIATTHRKDSYNTPKKWKGYSDKKWHNLAMIYNGSSLKLYVDCKLFSEEKNVKGKLKTDKRDIRIGAAANGNYFDGRIDEVKIYGKALSSEEIKEECDSMQ